MFHLDIPSNKTIYPETNPKEVSHRAECFSSVFGGLYDDILYLLYDFKTDEDGADFVQKIISTYGDQRIIVEISCFIKEHEEIIPSFGFGIETTITRKIITEHIFVITKVIDGKEVMSCIRSESTDTDPFLLAAKIIFVLEDHFPAYDYVEEE